MPVIKSAKKKLRQDKKRTAVRAVFEDAFKKALKTAKKTPTAESVRLATKATDKAVKYHIIHKNKGARVKSALSKLIAGKSTPKAAEAKPAAKKSPAPAAVKAMAGKKKATKSAKK